MKLSVKNVILSFLLIQCVFFISCTSKSEKKQTQKELLLHQNAILIQSYLENLKIQQDQAVCNFVENLSLEEKISQLFIENLEGNTAFRTFEEEGDISHTKNQKPLIAGGYLFFSANLAPSAGQIMNFTTSIRNFSKENNLIPPFLAIDQEGGFVNRLRGISGPLPSCLRVSECLSAEESYELYALQANQMKLLGFNMNLAPVAEVLDSSNQVFLNGRSFGSSSQVKSYGENCVNAYQKNGISTVLKHFPGNTNTDPHTGLPEIELSKEELEASLEPFYYLLARNPQGILMSHTRTTAYNPELPSCLSYFWVTEVLRQKCGYKGIIFSDDIFMAALAKNGYPPKEAVVMAIEAGIDCIMTSERRFSKPASYLYNKAVEDKAFEQKIDEAVKRIIIYKIDAGLLEFDYSNGECKVEVPSFYKVDALSLDERLSYFEDAKSKNAKFYMKHFVSE